MPKYVRPLIFCLILLTSTACVTMKNYRSTKAQMLVGEVELHHRDITIDSLKVALDSIQQRADRLEEVTTDQHKQINSLSTDNLRLKEEYVLLMDELKQLETKKNAVQKSSSKAKR